MRGQDKARRQRRAAPPRANKARRKQPMSTSSVPAQFTEAELKLLQALVYQECGMYFDERRAHFLQDRLQRRLRECQLDSFYSYYRLLISAEGKHELARLLENLAVNETSFFRNRAQMDLFHKYVLDELLRYKQARRDFSLRIWSAGCSTGQEPYTIAMLVADALAYYYLRNPFPCELPSPKPLIPPPWKAEILASDISYPVLRAGQEGIYTEAQMASVDYSYRLRYFDKIGDRYAVKKAVKELVHFDFHNLKTEYLPQRNDIIFCRNVMMYFDEAEQKRLTEKFARCLNPEGYLFVGHAESLLGLTDKFSMVHRNSGTAYQRVEVTA
jgi:chemotaxis protein methyltransferase CheR